MRDLTTLLRLTANAEEGRIFLLLDMQLSVPIRYTNCDIDLYIPDLLNPGELFKFDSSPFSIGLVNYTAKSSVDKLEVELQNVDLAMSAIFLNEDILNKWVTLKVVFLDEHNTLIENPIELFKGLISSWDLKDLRAKIILVNELIFWNKKTLRTHQSSCRWRFKGLECTYSGLECECDRSYAKCASLENTDNFGGFRFLPVLSEKEIYWGRQY